MNDQTRTKSLNVPCTGKFLIAVDGDEWTVTLSHKNGEVYLRYSESVFEEGGMFNIVDVFDTIILEPWMWECVQDSINELTIACERDSIVTPHTVQEYVQ